MKNQDIIDKAQRYFSDIVEQGSDQQLFIASYVQGHFSLAMANVQLNQLQSPIEFKQLLNNSLAQAFAKQELELEDQTEAYELVEQLFVAY